MFAIIDKITDYVNKFIHYNKPRIYNCRDVWLVMWREKEYVIRK